MATKAQQQAFVQQYTTYAQQVASQTGDSTDEILGQWANETGWGTRFKRPNNPGNLHGGTYSTMQAGVQAYADFLKQHKIVNDASNPTLFDQSMLMSGYNHHTAYPYDIAQAQASVPGLTPAQQQEANTSVATLNPHSLGYSASQDLLDSEAGHPEKATPETVVNEKPRSSSGCPTPSLTDPGSWVTWAQCEGFNLMFILLGVFILLVVITTMLKDQGFSLPPIPVE